MSKVKKENPSFKEGMANYFKGVKLEWGRITWPERKQVFAETIMVLVIVFIFTAMIFVIDNLYAFVLSGKLFELLGIKSSF